MKFFIPLVYLFFFCDLSAQTNRKTDIDTIRANRAASNKAIARHDMNQVSSYFLNDFIAVWANGTSSVGRDSATARMKNLLDQTPGLTYVRTPENIMISDADTLAFETGKWIGLKTKEKHPKWIGGKYSAMWWKRNGVWKLRSELFVGLKHY